MTKNPIKLFEAFNNGDHHEQFSTILVVLEVGAVLEVVVVVKGCKIKAKRLSNHDINKQKALTTRCNSKNFSVPQVLREIDFA